MKLIKPYFEIIEQQPGLEGVYKQIELGARLCYKSENKITEDSYKRFMEMLNTKGHLSPYEHGTVYLKVPNSVVDTGFEFGTNWSTLCRDPYTKYISDGNYYYYSTNYRVIIEHNLQGVLEHLCDPTEHHEKRITVKFVCSRGVWNEFIRHRVINKLDDTDYEWYGSIGEDSPKYSYCQESQRYCNYSKDKYNNEVTFCIPCWTNLKEVNYSHYDGSQKDWFTLTEAEKVFVNSLKESELKYLQLTINMEWKPQQAREVLPNATKTELMMTGFISDWEKFFKLRCQEAAHPSARELAIPLKEEFIKRGWLNE